MEHPVSGGKGQELGWGKLEIECDRVLIKGLIQEGDARCLERKVKTVTAIWVITQREERLVGFAIFQAKEHLTVRQQQYAAPLVAKVRKQMSW